MNATWDGKKRYAKLLDHERLHSDEDRERWARQLADIEAFEAGQAAHRRREFWNAVAWVVLGFFAVVLLGLIA